MYHHRERNSWVQQVRLIFLKHSCQSVLNYPRDQCATSIHQSRKIEISLHSLCHASFPLNHTERNGNIAQFLEQHFAFMLWYLPQPILLAFSFLTKEGAKYFVRKKSCVLKTYEKKTDFYSLASLCWITPEGPCFKFFKQPGHWWFWFCSEKPSADSWLHAGGRGVTAKLSRCYRVYRVQWSPLLICSNMLRSLGRTLSLKYNSDDTSEITLPVDAEAIQLVHNWITECTVKVNKRLTAFSSAFWLGKITGRISL